VNPETRIPRNYNQFTSLLEQLYKTGKVPPNEELTLLRLEKKELGELIQDISPTETIALSSHGQKKSMNELARIMKNIDTPLVMIGAYPKGPMEETTSSLADHVYSVHDLVLEAWTVTSRLLYEYENQIFRSIGVNS
jgi:rRNA small subunit pseudouridine methyltransferase Nep1